jgi:hypothetical protein
VDEVTFADYEPHAIESIRKLHEKWSRDLGLVFK